MEKFERETFSSCIYNFWVFCWLWAVITGFGALIVTIILVVSDVVVKGTGDEWAFLVWKWSYGIGMACFSTILIFLYIKGLIGLSRYKKEAVAYTEEKELKEFISYCKQKKGLR